MKLKKERPTRCRKCGSFRSKSEYDFNEAEGENYKTCCYCRGTKTKKSKYTNDNDKLYSKMVKMKW